MTEVRRRAIVRGMVQGVGFRMNTRAQAVRLGITGSASNLSDGTVEVLAQGDASAVESLLEWLETGPRFARVDSVSIEELPLERDAGFDVG